MALAVMSNRPFAGQYRIKRAGAVIYFALEGAGTLQSRLAAIARQHGAPDKLPFAWRGDCPLLTAKDAGPAIAAHCDAAARYFKQAYGVPTVLILIDTYSVAAGFTLSGDDSDVSATQKTFNALRYVHKHTGAAVVVVDHFKDDGQRHARVVEQRRQCRRGAGDAGRQRTQRHHIEYPAGGAQATRRLLRF
jgi:AAA domain